MVFRPRIDRWLALLLGGCMLAPWGLAGWMIYQGNGKMAPVLIAVGVLDLFLIRVLLWPMRYEVTPEAVIVRAGLVSFRIPYDRIQRITAHHPLRDVSLRALSFSVALRDVLRIEYGRPHRPGWLVIAPEDPDTFLDAVASYAPLLRRTGPRGLIRIQKENGHATAMAAHARHLFGHNGP